MSIFAKSNILLLCGGLLFFSIITYVPQDTDQAENDPIEVAVAALSERNLFLHANKISRYRGGLKWIVFYLI
jgi:hypothetical protein